jgi:hypothetical protein
MFATAMVTRNSLLLAPISHSLLRFCVNCFSLRSNPNQEFNIGGSASGVLKIGCFLDVTPNRLADGYRRFEGAHCLHL